MDKLQSTIIIVLQTIGGIAMASRLSVSDVEVLWSHSHQGWKKSRFLKKNKKNRIFYLNRIFFDLNQIF